MIVQRATWDGCRVPTPDERLAIWAWRYMRSGHYRNPPARLPSGSAAKLPAPVGRCEQAVSPSGKQALIPTRCPAYPGEDLT